MSGATTYRLFEGEGYELWLVSEDAEERVQARLLGPAADVSHGDLPECLWAELDRLQEVQRDAFDPSEEARAAWDSTRGRL